MLFLQAFVTATECAVVYMHLPWDIYIPGKRDTRPVISHWKHQCLSEAEEVSKSKPKTLPRLHESTDISQGI